MKKIIALLLIAVMALGSSACQKTPESPIVVGKNQDAMIEHATSSQNTDANDSIRKQFNIPDELNYANAYSETLSINVSAHVIVPECSGIPLLKIAPADFSQELVTKLFNGLCGDRVMYDNSQSTRKQLEEEIILIKQVLQDPQYAEDEEMLTMYRNLLRVTEKKWETAPDSDTVPLCNGNLHFLTRYDPVSGEEMYTYYGLSAADADKETTFFVENNNSMTETYVTKREGEDIQGGIPVKKKADLCYTAQAAPENYTTSPTSCIFEYDIVPSAVQGNMSITPNEALEYIAPLLTGTDMVVDGVYLAAAENDSSYAYKICYTRKVEGVCCTFLDGMYTSHGDDSFAPSWYYEGLEILINDDGIIRLDWVSPFQVVETISESCHLIQFDEIQNVFDKMVKIKYAELSKKDNEQKVRIDISKIRLEFNRIVEKNSIHFGLLIPVWSFYGKVIFINEDGSETIRPGFYNDGRDEIIVQINALDGSIIDLMRGY